MSIIPENIVHGQLLLIEEYHTLYKQYLQYCFSIALELLPDKGRAICRIKRAWAPCVIKYKGKEYSSYEPVNASDAIEFFVLTDSLEALDPPKPIINKT